MVTCSYVWRPCGVAINTLVGLIKWLGKPQMLHANVRHKSIYVYFSFMVSPCFVKALFRTAFVSRSLAAFLLNGCRFQLWPVPLASSSAHSCYGRHVISMFGQCCSTLVHCSAKSQGTILCWHLFRSICLGQEEFLFDDKLRR